MFFLRLIGFLCVLVNVSAIIDINEIKTLLSDGETALILSGGGVKVSTADSFVCRDLMHLVALYRSLKTILLCTC